MNESSESHLKLFTEALPQGSLAVLDGLESVPDVLKAFHRTTGWQLKYVPDADPNPPTDLTWSAPVNPGVGATLGHFRLEPADSRTPSSGSTSPEKACEMASAVANMTSELLRYQHALWQREAELAAGVPLVQHPEEQKHLAMRLGAAIKGGAEAVGCQAAAIYLLDDATSQLKLRSSWGLPKNRLTHPPRQLATALADLEAMLGHAVVLNDLELMERWSPPEDYLTAVCVPISSPTNILGTLWMFSDTKRDFTDAETNIIEVVAGRVASDLEREMLLREGVDGAQLKRQVAAAERLQQNQFPTISPLLDGWEMAGWTSQAESVGGDFYDWFGLPDGLVAAAVGDVMDRGVEAALAAATVRSALRSHGQYQRSVDSLLEQVNLTLWTGSSGDQFASLFCCLLETSTGRIRYGSAGRPSAILIRPDGWKSLTETSPPLGDGPDPDYGQLDCQLQPGEALVVFTDGVRDALDRHGCPLGEEGLAGPLSSQLGRSAKELVRLAQDCLEKHAPAGDIDDRTILIIKRTTT